MGGDYLCEDYPHTSLGANRLNWQVFLDSRDITALLPLLRFPFISQLSYHAIISSAAADYVAPTLSESISYVLSSTSFSNKNDKNDAHA